MLKNMSVTFKLLLLLILPLLVIAGFAAFDGMARTATIQSMEKLSHMMNIAASSGDLIHELQKERGTSVGFAASQGKLFAANLAQQHSASKRVGATFREDIARFKKLYPQEKLGQNLSHIIEQLNEVQSFQNRVQSLEVGTEDIIKLYTRQVRNL